MRPLFLTEDKIPYWDFDAPGEERDASAGAVMASALFELSGYSATHGKEYSDAAKVMLTSLASPAYKAALNTNGNFLLMHSVGAKPLKSEINTPLVYADYYYLEALLRYDKQMKKGVDKKLSATKNAVVGSLIFQNGFEGTAHILRNVSNPGANITTGYAIDDIEGANAKGATVSDWVKDLDENPDAGRFFF